jgi:thymidine phosphorylase
MEEGLTSPPGWCVDAINAFAPGTAQDPDRIADLATRLAQSGHVYDPALGTVDVASTGGPASLTTFIPPLILAGSGSRVAKIGVPGRPAGVIDSLGVLDGYRTTLSVKGFEAALNESGFANTLAAGTFAPADGILFRARQQLGAQAVPALVVASLLSKKIAAGVTRVAFDVRTFPGGNFGTTVECAHANVTLLQETARRVGIEAVCLVTDGDAPAQPMIGRFEALWALRSVLIGTPSDWLSDHLETCIHLAAAAANRPPAVIDLDALIRAADDHLTAQGTTGLDALDRYIEGIENRHRFMTIKAPRSGILSWKPAGLRAAVLSFQSTGEQAQFADGCGIELHCMNGSTVQAGQPIARLRIHESDLAQAFSDDVLMAVRIEEL